MKKHLTKLEISEQQFRHTFIWKKVFISRALIFIFLLGICWLLLSFYWRSGYPLVGILFDALILLLGVIWGIFQMLKRNVIEINSNDLLAKVTPMSLKDDIRIPIDEIDSIQFKFNAFAKYDVVVQKRNGETVKIVKSAGDWAEARGLKVELNKSLKHFQNTPLIASKS